MSATIEADKAEELMRATVSVVSNPDLPDLSLRQLSVLLLVHLTDGPHTVRGLAATMKVSKPAITRALDRLGQLDMAKRKVDPMDRRSVVVQRTLRGDRMVKSLRKAMAEGANGK